MKIEKVTRKTFKIRPSGRSSDYITPSFGYGCSNCTYSKPRKKGNTELE